MANAKHLEILLQGVEVWNRWREQNSTFEIDLKGAFLNGTDLRDANLSDANLSEVDLRDANLKRTNLLGAELSWALLHGANLSDAKLIQVNLSDANLSGANLERAELIGVQLVDADLSYANLNKAKLLFSDLIRTNLEGATFIGADFMEANLKQVNLDGANFSDASISDMVFAYVDFSSVLGLDSVKHSGPSTIGTDTMILSQGKIPEVFLRGCGVPQELTAYLPSLLNQPIQFYSCFISHSIEDIDFARQLHDFLQGRGIRCWRAEHQLLPGHDIHEEIDRGIKLWDKVILCASKASLNSWWVDKEIERIFTKERNLQQKRGQAVKALIPLDLDGYLLDEWDGAKASDIRSRLVANFRGWESDNKKMQQQLELVYKALRTDEGREKPPKSGLQP